MENVRQDLAEKDMNRPMGMALDQRQEEIEPSCKNLIISTHLSKRQKKQQKQNRSITRMSMSRRSMGDDSCCLICREGTGTSRVFSFNLDFGFDLEFSSVFVDSDLEAHNTINFCEQRDHKKRSSPERHRNKSKN